MNPQVWIRLFRALVLRQMPNYVIAFVTGRCPLKCGFCCQAASHARQGEVARELTPAQWAELFSGANALVHLTITGGEPFLREDIVPLVVGIVRKCGAPRISLNTNGFLTHRVVQGTEELLNALPGVDLSLAVSLDGDERVHDSLRGVSGSFAAAYETILKASDFRARYRHFSLRVCSVVCSQNAETLGNFIRTTASWPVDYHDIGLIRDVPREEQQKLKAAYAQLTGDQLYYASPRYKRSIDWRLQREVRKTVLHSISSDDADGHCLAGSRLLEILPDGAIRGCEMGRVWEHSLIASGEHPPVRLVDAVALPTAQRFQQFAAHCNCTFECAHGCNAVFIPNRWWRLLF